MIMIIAANRNASMLVNPSSSLFFVFAKTVYSISCCQWIWYKEGAWHSTQLQS